jgi:hypothetical protein
MALSNVELADTLPVPGFEYHTFMCSECRDVERRLVFIKQGRPGDAEPMPAHPAPPIAPPSPHQDQPIATPGFFRRVLAKLRGREADVQR